MTEPIATQQVQDLDLDLNLNKTKKKIVVVGAGLAGLSTCWHLSKNLSQEDFEIVLLEGRELLGGKISAWRDDYSDSIESGLHVFYGCYENLIELTKDTGIYENLTWQDKRSFVLKGLNGEKFSLNIPRYLPPPLNLLWSYIRHLRNKKYSLSQFWNYCRVLRKILDKNKAYIYLQDEISFDEWLKKEGLEEETFLPMTLPMKFLPKEKISAQAVLNTFRNFLSKWDGFKIAFLNGSPDERMTVPILNYLLSKGIKFEFQNKIRSLKIEEVSDTNTELGKKITGLVLETGMEISGDYFILALPTHKFRQLLSHRFPENKYFEDLKRFSGVPVMSAQYWLDKPILKDQRLHFGNGHFVRAFANKALLQSEHILLRDNAAVIHAVISPVDEIAHLSNDEVLKLGWEEIRAYLRISDPSFDDSVRVTKASLVRIPESVYAPFPKLEKFRPSQETPVENLFLAGGFTRGHDFFDTQEGAVKSGILAAKALLKKLNYAIQPESF